MTLRVCLSCTTSINLDENVVLSLDGKAAGFYLDLTRVISFLEKILQVRALVVV